MIIGVTGHRPDKLPDKETGYKLPNSTYIRVCQETEKIFKEFNPEKIITGMALGYDSWVANIAIKLKIPFVAAIPFDKQEIKWSEESQKTYHLLLKNAYEKVIVSSGGYSANKMQIRNKWIVDNCDLLVACFDGSSGGTFNCIEYAKSVNKKIIIIDPKV